MKNLPIWLFYFVSTIFLQCLGDLTFSYFFPIFLSFLNKKSYSWLLLQIYEAFSMTRTAFLLTKQSSYHLLVPSQLKTHQKKMWKTGHSGVFIVNFEQISNIFLVLEGLKSMKNFAGHILVKIAGLCRWNTSARFNAHRSLTKRTLSYIIT